MIDDLSELDNSSNAKVYTTNKELLNKIKELEFNRSLDAGNYGTGLFNLVCENIKVDRKDKYQFYIQFVDDKFNNKIEGYNSYIYSNDYEFAVLDLLNAMYNSGFVKLCADDVRATLNNKSFDYYRYIINESLSPKLLNKILDGINTNNKNCILICHGNNNIAYMEFDIIQEALKMRKNELWLTAYITNDIKSDDRYLSLYIEKDYN